MHRASVVETSRCSAMLESKLVVHAGFHSPLRQYIVVDVGDFLVTTRRSALLSMCSTQAKKLKEARLEIQLDTRPKKGIVER
jgi:hypothetical protein